jgi:hypothetical protein
LCTCSANEPFLPRLDRRLKSSVLAERELPLDHVDQVVQLQQVDVVDAETLERASNLFARSLVVALFGLRRKEEPARVALEPRCDPQLRVAVRGGGVDVVDAVFEQDLERRIRFALRERP